MTGQTGRLIGSYRIISKFEISRQLNAGKYLLPVDTESRDLGVEIGEVATLEKGIIGKSNARDNVAGAEGDLLSLGKELVDITIQAQLPDVPHRNQILWPDFGGVEYIKIKLVLIRFREDLDSELPLRVASVFNGFHQVLSVEIGILTGQLESLIPYEGVHAELGSPHKLDKVAFAFGVEQCECYNMSAVCNIITRIPQQTINTKALHHTVRPWNCSIAHSPHKHVSGFWMQILEIPEVVMCGLSRLG